MKILVTGGSGFIGTHFVDHLLETEKTFLNIDIQKPLKETHVSHWQQCDILDIQRLEEIFVSFQPTHILHLAAETAVDRKTLNDYCTNTKGTANLLEVIKQTPSVSRVVITSTQHVRKPGSGLPKHDEDFVPYQIYGESKVVTEKLTREACLECTWTIIRPTTVWGPWHPGLPIGFWRVLKQGRYFHPRNDPVIRSYGYVGNVIFQIEKILEALPSLVNHKLFYVGDICSKQINWVNGFSKALTGQNVREVPVIVLQLLAGIGDGLMLLGFQFPIHTSRFKNMTTSNLVPVEPTIDAFGYPPFSFEDGVKETVQWLQEQGYI